MHPLDRPDLPEMVEKLYYTISEVSEICGLKAHVLRYWEREFPSLRPRKGRDGSRRYRRRDIDEVLAIKSLLHEQGYRIAGARKALSRRGHPLADEAVAPPGPAARQLSIPFGRLDRPAQLDLLRRDLREILDLLRAMKSSRRRSAGG